jgi:cell division protein FtsN
MASAEPSFAQPAAVPQIAAAPPPNDAIGTAAFSQNPEPSTVNPLSAQEVSIDTLLDQIETSGRAEAKSAGAPQGINPAPVWVVQVASYDRETDAQSFAGKLKGKGYQANVAATEIAGKTRYRVEVGQLTTRNEAVALQKDLRVAQRIADSLVMSKLPAPAAENR